MGTGYGAGANAQAGRPGLGDWHSEAEVDTHAAAGELCPDSVQNWALYLERFGRGRNFARDIAPKIAPGLAANECAAG